MEDDRFVELLEDARYRRENVWDQRRERNKEKKGWKHNLWLFVRFALFMVGFYFVFTYLGNQTIEKQIIAFMFMGFFLIYRHNNDINKLNNEEREIDRSYLMEVHTHVVELSNIVKFYEGEHGNSIKRGFRQYLNNRFCDLMGETRMGEEKPFGVGPQSHRIGDIGTYYHEHKALEPFLGKDYDASAPAENFPEKNRMKAYGALQEYILKQEDEWNRLMNKNRDGDDSSSPVKK